jgi:ATP-dependent DNA helicase RecG
MPNESDEISQVIGRLLELPTEIEWVEFKRRIADPEEIGEYIAAMANAATLAGVERGYVVWGIEDKTHDVVGTNFRPREVRIGNEELENWLARLLSPRIDFRFREGFFEDRPVVLLEVPRASHTPVRFRDNEWIRVGSYKKKLKDFPEKERRLWKIFDQTTFEDGIAKANLSAGEVLALLVTDQYYQLLRRPMPIAQEAVIEALEAERILVGEGTGKYGVTNLGAVLLANDLSEFGALDRKKVRIVEYSGANKAATRVERIGRRGYAAGFQGLVQYIMGRLPKTERVSGGLRRTIPLYPELAIRELVANAVIHQDFHVSGAGPMIELYADRVEITNPGPPLVEVNRMIDAPPRSRNDRLASLMRRFHICEERGSGIDKVILEVEKAQLPPPDFRIPEGHTVAVLFGPRKLNQMTRQEKLRACYQHACLQFVSNLAMTNASLRARLSISDENYSLASRIIGDALDDGLIKPLDPTSQSKRHAKYIPFWG